MLIGRADDTANAAAASDRAGPVDERLVFHALPGSTREDVIQELSRRLQEEGLVPDARELSSRLLERERLGCTGLGGGVAIPHCKLPAIADVIVAVATPSMPIDFEAADGMPIRLIVLVVSPADAAALHLQALARVSRLLRAPGLAASLMTASSKERLLERLREAETAQAVSA